MWRTTEDSIEEPKETPPCPPEPLVVNGLLKNLDRPLHSDSMYGVDSVP